MKKKKLLLISLDALSCTDLAYVKKLPGFKRLLAEGAFCPRECSVYPSVTFPCHASIATGCVPDSHGIVNNYLFDPFASLAKWNFYASNLKRKAIWDYAAENGKKVLNMSWPVSSGADIAYSMPEMSPAKPKEWNMGNFIRQLDVFRRYGTPGFAIRTLLEDRRLPKAWFLGKQPQLDECMLRSFVKAIRKWDFDIAMLHVYGLDDAKHTYGTKDEICRQYLKKYDWLVRQLLAYEEERKEENVTIMITGDHAQKDVKYSVYGNMILERHGLCRFADGRLKEYQAYMESCDGMAYLRIHDSVKDKEAMTERLREIFEGQRGVKAVMTGAEGAKWGADSQAPLILEAEDFYAFEGGYEEKAKESPDLVTDSHYRGLHGYLPDGEDYRTMFFCHGQDVKPGEIKEMCITDILPSICQWMGFVPEETDGVARPEIWNEG